MRRGMWLAAALTTAICTLEAAPYPKMWVYGAYNMATKDGFEKTMALVERSAKAGYTGLLIGSRIEDAMFLNISGIRDHYTALREKCAQVNMEIIPGVFGFNAGFNCYRFPETVEATALKDLTYTCTGNEAVFEPEAIDFPAADFAKKTLKLNLKPFRHYRLSFKLKTENLLPDIYNKFRIGLHQPKTMESQLYDPPMKPTQDWTDVRFEFQTYESGEVLLSARKGRKDVTGSFAVKDVTFEEVGPRLVFHTDGMAAHVRDAITGTVYEEGRDYLPLPKMKSRFRYAEKDPVLAFTIPSGSRIKKETKLAVDCWEPGIVGTQQYYACPSTAARAEFEKECAKRLHEFFKPKTWLLGIDEWRLANRCKRCAERNMTPAQLAGEAVSRQYAIIRALNPKAEIAAWADMFCPTDNAHDHYYCVKGSFEGTWNLVPKDIIMTVWENGHGPIALKHCAENGFPTLAGAYYDHNDLENDKKWLAACNETPGCLGMMYTSWERKYALLEDFAKLVTEEGKPKAVNAATMELPPYLTEDLDAACQRAKAQGKNVLVSLGREVCGRCQIFYGYVKNGDVKVDSAKWTLIRLDVDNPEHRDYFLSTFEPPDRHLPFVGVMNGEREALKPVLTGKHTAAEYQALMQ